MENRVNSADEYNEQAAQAHFERMRETHGAARKVWLNLLLRYPTDETTWLRFGYSSLMLQDVLEASSAFLIAECINPGGKAMKYLDSLFADGLPIPAHIIDQRVQQHITQYHLQPFIRTFEEIKERRKIR